jgi:diguanylate cyclase (GGDEF)-like protein
MASATDTTESSGGFGDRSVTHRARDTDPARRLTTIEDLHLLDSIGDPVLNGLTQLARGVTGTAVACIHVFDDRYQRRIAASGWPLVDVPEEKTLCRITVETGEPVRSNNATGDERFQYLWPELEEQEVKLYASVPVTVGGGSVVGTVCVIDPNERALSDEQMQQLEQIAELARAHLELAEIATNLGTAAAQDSLTGIYNRGVFDARLTQALARMRRHSVPVLVALIDLDKFKHLNDNYGHAVGDAALRWVADGLKNGVREEDTVGRLGGDEFGLVAELGEGGADALLDYLEQIPVGFTPQFTLSVGAVLAGPGDDVATVLARADEAMYTAKRGKPAAAGR